MGCASRSFLFFLPNTSLISRCRRSPTLHSPEHFVVHGFEWPGGRHGGGEPSAEEPERGSGRGDCGGRERGGGTWDRLAHPASDTGPGRDAPGSRVGRWQMRRRGLRARAARDTWKAEAAGPRRPEGSFPRPSLLGEPDSLPRRDARSAALRLNGPRRSFLCVCKQKPEARPRCR